MCRPSTNSKVQFASLVFYILKINMYAKNENAIAWQLSETVNESSQCLFRNYAGVPAPDK
jgi:hypothetical protein